ncbi:MAG TPA: TIGR01777 family oxidoreductase [Lacipirellulaceae bacterium]|nr:TIGR01777 family oxidoreductase [Lacipirellulaceae bacterium]
MIIAVTGSSGLIGSALVADLEANGHLVRPVVRRLVREEKHEIHWDPTSGTIDAAEFAGVDAVVHLAGENLAAHRWTPQFKEKILTSRVNGTKLLCDTLAALAAKPTVLVSASAIGYYGNRGDERLDESSPPGHSFLASVCQQWEAATLPARDADIRVVNLRIGVVLSTNGGALTQMLTPFKLGLGGVVGSGQQYLSWITLEDVVRAIQFVLHAAALTGPVNAVAPEPVTNREFTKTLGRILKRPTIMAMPAAAARLAFGEMADEMLLCSARVEPHALATAEFSFERPQLEPALKHLLT